MRLLGDMRLIDGENLAPSTVGSLAGHTPNREGKGGLVTSRTTTCAGGMQ